MPDEINERLARLEAWMQGQHWPGDPIRITPNDAGPHDQEDLEQRQKRAEQAAREETLDSFRKPAEQNVEELKARIAKLEERLNTLHGQNGIRVTGSVIDFIPAQARVAKADQIGSTLEVRDQGVSLTFAATTLDFTGLGVTATEAGDVVTIDIPGGSGTPYNLDIKDYAGTIVAGAISIKFLGQDTVTVTDLGGGNAQVEVTGLEVKEDGSSRTLPTTIIDFTGAGVDVAAAGTTATVDIPGFTLKTQEDGSDKSDPTNILNFTGAVTVTGPGSTATVDVPGDTTTVANGPGDAEILETGTNVTARSISAADASIVVTQNAHDITIAATGTSAAEISVLEEGSELTATVASIDFVGETITAAAVGNDVTVTMSELTFSFCTDGAAVDYIVAAVEAP